MTTLPGGGPNEVFRDFPPGPHSGVPTDHDLVAPDTIDSRARAALTLGVLSLVLNVLTGVPAIVVGRRALRHIHAADGALKGRWAAWIGIALGILSVVVAVVVFVYLHQHPSSHKAPSTHA